MQIGLDFRLASLILSEMNFTKLVRITMKYQFCLLFQVKIIRKLFHHGSFNKKTKTYQKLTV